MISFSEYFAAVHCGYEPYPWQVRFAEACAADVPPQLVPVPTGAGKTTVLDALLWALAFQFDRPACARTVGCRTVWAIDRRILVDEVHEHACKLAARLQKALGDDADALHSMADRLQTLSGGGPPLVATRWRGGIDDEEPLLSPTQPQVITSTIAQIGSRLLFRGYGIGARSLALHAGLAASDTNVCLDEAHLAQPFVETVEAIRRLRSGHGSALALPPLIAITLTATPGKRPEDAIELSAADRSALGRRLTAPKIAHLDETEGTEHERAVRLAELTATHAEDGVRRVACVVNTVRQAIAVYDLLTKQDKRGEWDIALLIGPQRPVDREKLLDGPASALFSKEPPEKPLVCVATQTFEVGLDADVEALVTESASASAIVQRLGRLNRRGGPMGRATIVRNPGSWLYGEDEKLAWEWLQALRDERGEIDVSVAALERDQTRPVPLTTPLAPELTDETLDLLVQTNPLPGPFQDPDIEPFMVGVESEPASDGAICWRSDLRIDEADDEYRRTLLELARPQPAERLTMSLRAARILLAALHPGKTTNRRTAMQVAATEPDIEGSAPDLRIPPTASDEQAQFMVIRRREVKKGALRDGTDDAISLYQLAPGDTIVLPSELGATVAGLGTWVSPDYTADAAPDVLPQSAVPSAIRISPEAFDEARRRAEEKGGLTAKQWSRIAALCQGVESSTADDVRKAVEWLAESFPFHTSLAALLEAARDGSELRIDVVRSSSLAADELPLDENESDPESAAAALDDEFPEPPPGEDDDEERAERTGPTWVIRAIPKSRKDRVQRPRGEVPTIAEHAEAVRARVSEYCDRLQLDATLVAALELAARVHDHGKADRRIQDFFRGGVPSIGEQPIAKSLFGTGNRRLSEQAATRAGLPNGLHHEIASAAILLDAAGCDPGVCPAGIDLSLALYLVLGHHGRGQPFPAVPAEGAPPPGVHCDAAGITGSARGDGVEDWTSGAPLERFWEVIHRYGAWGATYLLSILVLADRTVSSEGR